MAENLFAEFPSVSTEQWEEVIIKDLKGADYDKRLVWKTSEGFSLRPYYRSENLKDLKHLKLAPGEFPFVRGVCKKNKWKISQTFDPCADGVKGDNARILSSLMRGTDSIAYKVRTAEGLKDQDFNDLMKGINMPSIETNFKVRCTNGLATLGQVINKVKAEGWEPKEIKGSIDYDPLRRLTLKGAYNPKNGDAFEYAKKLIEKSAELPSFRVIAVSPYIFHNAGSNTVQELAYGLCMGSEYIAKLSAMGLQAEDVARRIKFTFAIGSSYFMEIAKIRAARMLWANIVKAYGVEKNCAMKMRVHAVTSQWNQTVYDPYVNMLRGTTEAMSGAIAGVDSMEVTPFDASFTKAGEFSSRIARNTQLLLKEESYLDRVTDPAAGSYYIENLTASIANEAWKLFKEIEAKGGYIAALKEGVIQKAIKEAAQKRDMNIATRREILLGTNQYPNFGETLSAEVIAKFESGSCCSCCGSGEAKEVEPICEYRGSQAFEQMRAKSEKKQPSVFMLTYGSLAMCRARAQFASNFFACAGFTTIDNNRFATVEEGIEAAIKAGSQIVVACSSDDEYIDSVVKINDKLGSKAIVVVAGEPACKADLEAKGITHFISVKTNVLETLKQYQKELGIA